MRKLHKTRIFICYTCTLKIRKCLIFHFGFCMITCKKGRIEQKVALTFKHFFHFAFMEFKIHIGASR